MLKEVLSGRENEALQNLKELINDGLDAKNFLNDILEVLYIFSRRINLGPIEKDMSISESEMKMIDEHSKNLNMQDIGLFWQLTIKTIDDLRVIGNENLTLEMYIVQLIHLRSLDEQKEIYLQKDTTMINNENLSGQKLDEKNIETDLPKQMKNQLKNINQIKTSPDKNISIKSKNLKIDIKSFQDLIDMANKEKEIELKYDLERNVKLVSFNKGKIDISFNDKLNKNFIKTLTEKLLKWTGERWIISLSKNAEAKSIYEKNLKSKENNIKKFEDGKFTKEFRDAFPDAELIEIKDKE